MKVSDVRRFYESDVVIDTFDAGFAGRWHTRVYPDIPGIEDSDHLVCEWLGMRPEHRVLDFGSGSGVTTCGLARRTGSRLRGLNVSAKQVALGEEYAALSGLSDRVGFDRYPGRKFPYRSGSFDRVTFFESPCHVPHKPLLFREMFRVLRPGGACAGQDWMLVDGDISPADYERYILPIERSCEVSLLSLSAYRALMERAGFSNVRAVDGRDLDPALSKGFTQPTKDRIRVGENDGMATRLRKGNVALSNAFHRGLFTIGLFCAEKPSKRARRSSAVVTATERVGRLVPTAELTPAAFSPEKNLACIDFHRSAFSVPMTEPLAVFRRMVERAQGCTVEASCKVEALEVRASRFNLFHHGRHKEPFLERVFGFFDEVERVSRLRLDRAPIRRFMGSGIEFDGVRKVVTGIDLHPEPTRSRLKLWFMLRGAPKLVERAIALHGDSKAIRALQLHDEFLVGFDLRFDGTTGVKIYPDLLPEELRVPKNRARLARVLSERSLEAAERCRWTHVYLAKHNPDTVLQFHPADPDAFVARYLPRGVGRKLHAVYDRCRLLDMVVSVQDGELQRRAVESFALYWMPAEPPP